MSDTPGTNEGAPERARSAEAPTAEHDVLPAAGTRHPGTVAGRAPTPAGAGTPAGRTGADEDEPLRLGGMALRNGLLVHGPRYWGAAVRDRHGVQHVASGRIPRISRPGEEEGTLRSRLGSTPGLRGVLRLGESVVVLPLIRRRLPQARLPMEDGGIVVAAVGASVLGTRLRRRGGAVGRTAASVLSVVPSLVTLGRGDIAAWHGSEHKAIGAYERGVASAEATKEHERCGSHLVAPMLATEMAGSALVRRLAPHPHPLHAPLVQLAAAAIAVELFAWSEKHGETVAARALRAPGFALQRAIGTREPSAEQLETAQAALRAVLDAEAEADAREGRTAAASATAAVATA